MKIQCPHCQKRYRIKDEKLPLGKSIQIPCPSCKGTIVLDLTRPDRQGRQTIPAPGGPATDMPTAVAADEAGRLESELLLQWEELPPMLEVLVKIRQILQNPDASLKKVARVVETDPGIAARILKIANSAFYGLSGNVSSVQHAAVVLGFQTLEDVVTMASTSDFLGKKLDGYGIGAGDLWRHALTVAIGTRKLVLSKDPKLENDAFSAGLFHDLGKIMLDPFIHENQVELQRRIEEGGRPWVTAEREVLGFDHAHLTASLCENWNFPPAQSQAIRYHHYPARSQANLLSYALHVIDALSAMHISPADGTDVAPPLEEGALDFLGIELAELTEMMEEVAVSVDQITGEMGA